jgi:hypothetical protein
VLIDKFPLNSKADKSTIAINTLTHPPMMTNTIFKDITKESKVVIEEFQDHEQVRP